MNRETLSKALRVVAAAALLLAASVGAAPDTYLGQVNAAKVHFQFVINHLSEADKATLKQTIGDLEGSAGELDNLASQITAKAQEVSTAQDAYNAANATAAGLRQQADAATQDAQAKIHQFELDAPNICSQMGGSVSGTQCLFKCPEDQEAVCSQKVSTFNSRIAELKGPITDAIQYAKDRGQAASDQETDVTDKQTALQNAQLALDSVKKDLASKSSSFRWKLQSLDAVLTAAEKTPLNLHLGSAFRQAQTVLSHLNANEFSCYDRACFDLGANSDGTLVVPPPPAMASAPAANDGQLQKDLQQLTTQYNDALQQLQEAKVNNDPAVGDRVKQLALIQGKLDMKAFELKTARAMNSYKVDMKVAP